MSTLKRLLEAADTYDIQEFLDLAFPPAWGGIAARILETGAQMASGPCLWAPRWSRIPPTVRTGVSGDQTKMKSIIFRAHDCLHQLWGLPHPGEMTEEDHYYYKRVQMCGEVAVLTLTEFVYVKWLYDTFEELRPWVWERNAIPLMFGPLRGKTTEQIAMRLDDLLHKKSRPKWVRDWGVATAFVNDYVPMLERDRQAIDQAWAAMQAEPGWAERNLRGAPKARFARHLDGLELTLWMVHDFEHLLATEPGPDWALVEFNRKRRDRIVLPAGWPA